MTKHPSLLRILIPILICALLCAGIPTVMIVTGHAELVRSAVNTVFVPIEHVFSGAGNGIRNALAYFTEFDTLKAENERLRAQLAAMEDQIRTAERTLSENKFLSEFLELKENHADYRFLKCEVVAYDNTGYRSTLTLNAGTGEGAAVGYPVITAEGVVGRITEVGVNWSKAEPITTPSSAVGAYAERSGAAGIASGDYTRRADGTLLFTYLDTDADIAVGDRIRTSGVNSFYPRGLLLGEITELLIDSATLQKSAVIQPAAAQDTLRDVMILTDFAIYDTEQKPSEIKKDTAETTA